MVCGRRIYFVWPPFSLRTAHASAFRLFLLSSAGGVGNRPRWYTPWVHHRCGATNRKVPSTSIQVPPLWKIRDFRSAGSVRLRLSGLKSRATLIRRYTFLKQFVRDDLNQLIQLYVQKGFSKTDCQRVLYRRQFKIPKLLALESSYWYADEVANFPVRFLQITCWCLASTQLKEHMPGYVPFCVCQALYQRVLHLLWLTSTNLFLAAFFHKLLTPLRL